MDTVTKGLMEKRIDGLRDDIGHRFDGLRAGMDSRFDDLRAELGHRFDAADQRAERNEREMIRLRVEMKEGFERVDDRFERMYRLLCGAAAGIIASLVGLVATQF